MTSPAEPQVGANEARNNFAEIIGRAGKDGQPTTITHRGFPVARVVPPTGDPELALMNRQLAAYGYPAGLPGLHAMSAELDRLRRRLGD